MRLDRRRLDDGERTDCHLPVAPGTALRAVDAVGAALREAGLAPEVGPMSTIVTGESATVFSALERAFERASSAGHVVMTITVSNACPVRP